MNGRVRGGESEPTRWARRACVVLFGATSRDGEAGVGQLITVDPAGVSAARAAWPGHAV